jgi:hypothetical protein
VFLIHPEALLEGELNHLKHFARLRSGNTTANPIVIVTSLEPKHFLLESCHPEKFTLTVDRDYIRECCDLAVEARGQHTFADFYAVWSCEPGTGKTRLINEYMDGHNPGKRRVHYYLDKTMDELPVDLAYPVVHMELSPDLFGNEFRLFDQLFQLAIYGYYIRSDSKIVSLSKCLHGNISPAIMFEVPPLKDFKTLADNPEDFPIACRIRGKDSSSQVSALASPVDFNHFINPSSVSFDEQSRIPSRLSAYLGHIFIADACPSTMPALIDKSAQLFFGLTGSVSPRTENNWRLTHYAHSYLESMDAFLPAFRDTPDEFFVRLALILLRGMFQVLPNLHRAKPS